MWRLMVVVPIERALRLAAQARTSPKVTSAGLKSFGWIFRNRMKSLRSLRYARRVCWLLFCSACRYVKNWLSILAEGYWFCG